MDRKKDDNQEDIQASRYDKILQENMEAALPGLIKNVLKINAVHEEELPDNLQFTKERKPDVLKKITDDKGNTFVLHLEFQTGNESKMAYRMAEYLVMLARRYQLEVRQYVIYIGEGVPSMRNELKLGESYFCYKLISFSSIDYRLFLRSDKLEEKMLALLGDFGKDSPQTVITKVTRDVLQNTKGELEREQRKNQLRILAQLRTLVSDNIQIMESVSTFFKEENDFLYRRGEKKGIERGIEKGEERKSFILVKNLLLESDFTVAKIASMAAVTEAFVRKVKKTLK
jgi:predicted transposase/invertase (TIGR01784 family)